MRNLCLGMLALLLTVGGATAQSSSGLSVTQQKWRAHAVSSYSSMLNDDPFSASTETAQSIQDQKDNLRNNIIRQQQGLSPLDPPIPRSFRTIVASNFSTPLVAYTYQIKVKNSGTKKITAVAWDYVFIDAVTHEQVGIRQFKTKTNISPNRTGKLSVLSSGSPIAVVNAANAGKKPDNKYIEQVNIRSVQYEDGTIWQADSK